MKKQLIITGMCVTLIGHVTPIYAATKCVALNSSTTCTASTEESKLDWNASCTTGGATVPIRGVAGCSSQNGGSIGVKSESIITSETSDDNKYCWCKMTSPAVSSWVFSHEVPSTHSCAVNCAPNCSLYVSFTPSFRSALFSALGD